MAIDRSAPLPALAGSRRMLEWSLVAAVIVVLGTVFFRQVQELQAQAEFSAVQSTLGALRTTLVITHLQRSIPGGTGALAASSVNPFDLLQRPPANYLGEMNSTQAREAAPGNWVFDPECVCVGYLPLHLRWIESQNGELLAWFRVTREPGSMLIAAQQRYVWQGKVLE